MPKSILIIEDDPAIRRGLRDILRHSLYRVTEAADGPSGLAAALAPDLDIILLDILMPGLDGLALLHQLRSSRVSTPVILLTAKGLEEDRVRGLRSGADDYIVKPFSPQELLARIDAVLRRSAERPRALSRLSLAGCAIDFERRQVTRPDGTSVVLPEIEANLLAYLAANPGRSVAREELLLRVWGLDPRGMQTRTVDMAVARLREHLCEDPDNPKAVITVRGKGYMLGTAS